MEKEIDKLADELFNDDGSIRIVEFNDVLTVNDYLLKRLQDGDITLGFFLKHQTSDDVNLKELKMEIEKDREKQVLKTAIDTKKTELVSKINTAANSELSIKILTASGQQTEIINHALDRMLKERQKIAQAFIISFDSEKENLLELFALYNENIKNIIGL